MYSPNALRALGLGAAHVAAVAAAEEALEGPGRGGPAWDPFRHLPEVRLSASVQNSLLDLHKLLTERVERLTSGGRERRRIVRLRTRVEESLLASVSLLLVRKVGDALNRHGQAGGASGEEYMSEALICASECIRADVSAGAFHTYVGSAVSATLAHKALDGVVFGGEVPEAWRVVLRHLPSVVSGLEETLGRAPSDPEVAEAFLQRAQTWARARLAEREGVSPCEVDSELVRERLTRQGVYAAVRRIADLRRLSRGTVRLDEEGEGWEAPAAPAAEQIVLAADSSRALQRLLDPIPDISTDTEPSVEASRRARTLLGSPMWHDLVAKGGLPTARVRVDRKAPSLARLLGRNGCGIAPSTDGSAVNILESQDPN